MKNNTRIAIAGLLTSLSGVLAAFAAEFNGGGTTPDNQPADAATPADAPTTKPAKPKKEKPAAPPVEEKPAEETADEPVGKTFEELKALIGPLVEAGQGLDVKALIKKYDPESATPSIKTMPAKNHAAFEKDLAALSY